MSDRPVPSRSRATSPAGTGATVAALLALAVLAPSAQAQETGKSIYFLLEANPGPGLGLLLAYWVFAKGSIRSSAPGAAIIHFLGGIHEVYFPYVLMKPALLLAVVAGGATALALHRRLWQ